jgi:O-antigen ligase
MNHARLPRALVAFATAAATLPALLAYNVSPSPTFLNQALAFGLWGAFVAATAQARTGSGPVPLLGALGLLTAAVMWAWGPGALPASLALSALSSFAAAAVVVLGAAGAGRYAGVRSADGRSNGAADKSPGTTDAVAVFAAFCWAWAICGAFNVAIALVQVFAPDWTSSQWIASSSYPGRAVGNLRQPNHLSSLLMWSSIALVALLELRRLSLRVAAPLGAAFVFCVVLTASRTGVLSVLLLALWGLLDRRLSRAGRGLLLAAPLAYGVAWGVMAMWASATSHSFGGAERLAETDISSSRFAIWRDTLTLIAQQPWRGTGWGEFNLAWTLTPLPQRPTAFFDHAHNLPLHLLAELGLPLGSAVLMLLVWALVRGAMLAWGQPPAANSSAPTAAHDDTITRRAAMMVVLMIGLHSLLEYPLWYSYFLLPTAWAWGYALRPSAAIDSAPTPLPAPPWLGLAGIALVIGAALSVLDYWRVVAIFNANPGAAPLAERVERGQRSVLFAHHADYADVTGNLMVGDPNHDFQRVVHYLLDTRLMLAWADALDRRGQPDQARHLAARLREFRKADAEAFFAECDAHAPAPAAAVSAPAVAASAPATAASAPPFQCLPPRATLTWREFVQP